jgi:hypothetical protein
MFFEELGLESTDYTDSVGWNLDNKMEVKFSSVLKDSKPCLAIGFSQNPRPDYDKTY